MTSALAAEPIVPKDAKLEKLWADGDFTEGPAFGPDHCIYFSDIGNRIMKFDPATGKTTEFRKPSGRANGLDFDYKGRLVAAEGANTGGNRRITVTDVDGSIRVLADKWKGKRFNSPNDLIIDRKNRVFFTDPRYVGNEPREIDTESVYRIDPNGAVTQIISDVQKPNGIVISPDGDILYLADSPAGLKDKRYLLAAYPPQGDDGLRRQEEGAARFRDRSRHRWHVHRHQGQYLCDGGSGQDWRRLYLHAGRQEDRVHPDAGNADELRLGGGGSADALYHGGEIVVSYSSDDRRVFAVLAET